MRGIIFSYIVCIYEIEYPDYCYSFNILCIDAFFKINLIKEIRIYMDAFAIYCGSVYANTVCVCLLSLHYFPVEPKLINAAL